jgi:hypothetical protein
MEKAELSVGKGKVCLQSVAHDTEYGAIHKIHAVEEDEYREEIASIQLLHCGTIGKKNGRTPESPPRELT